MTPEEQRISIAEALGFTHMEKAKGLMWNHTRNCAVITPGSDVEKARLHFKMEYIPGKQALPDYVNDLNAIHEAEKILSKEQWDTYLFWIKHLLNKLPAGEPHCHIEEAHAECQQRAEAFIRTIGKWKV